MFFKKKKKIKRILILLAFILIIKGVYSLNNNSEKQFNVNNFLTKNFKSNNKEQIEDNISYYKTNLNNNGIFKEIIFTTHKEINDFYLEINNNVPFFEEDLLSLNKSIENYAKLDDLGRARSAFAVLGFDIMPYKTEMVGGKQKLQKVKRVNRLKTNPSGWKQAKYDFIDGGHLYNRSHLIGYQLASENDNELNLITGTRQLNVEGMLPFENMVSDYIHKTKQKDKDGKVNFNSNHVLYRVTPVYKDNELVARGVLMEAKSVEDNQIEFCVFVPNAQKRIEINYLTGESVDIR